MQSVDFSPLNQSSAGSRASTIIVHAGFPFAAVSAICLGMLSFACDKSCNTHAAHESDLIPHTAAGQARDSSASDAEYALRMFTTQFEGIAAGISIRETQAERRRLAMEALPRIGGCDVLLRFLDYLSERGANDLREELVQEHLGVIFAGQRAKHAREWVLTVGDDQLKKALSLHAGKAFSGPGFKDYFEDMGVYGGMPSQAALLSGYCQALAVSDPEGAVRVYKELGYPKKIDNTGLAAVFESMPPNTNFLSFATGIREDSMTLAKLSRSALLRNWAGARPEEAAQYVLANARSGVAPDQVAQVIAVWARRAPESATTWVASVPDGEVKDEASAALAKFWEATEPIKAWDWAAKVSDLKKRVETATAVFREWEKTDRAAAEKAWLELFPGG